MKIDASNPLLHEPAPKELWILTEEPPEAQLKRIRLLEGEINYAENMVELSPKYMEWIGKSPANTLAELEPRNYGILGEDVAQFLISRDRHQRELNLTAYFLFVHSKENKVTAKTMPLVEEYANELMAHSRAIDNESWHDLLWLFSHGIEFSGHECKFNVKDHKTGQPLIKSWDFYETLRGKGLVHHNGKGETYLTHAGLAVLAYFDQKDATRRNALERQYDVNDKHSYQNPLCVSPRITKADIKAVEEREAQPAPVSPDLKKVERLRAKAEKYENISTWWLRACGASIAVAAAALWEAKDVSPGTAKWVVEGAFIVPMLPLIFATRVHKKYEAVEKKLAKIEKAMEKAPAPAATSAPPGP